MIMRPDPFKLARWMNTRKLTPEQLASGSGLPAEIILGMLSGSPANIGSDVVLAMCDALQVDVSQLVATSEFDEPLVIRGADELQDTRRTIVRAGIEFYNYYSMASPPGRVGPVILDVLCPQGKIPELNNGHLEPAITVNLGPGAIRGRWGESLTAETWNVLNVNLGSDRWITGDSYLEPPYCPHAYSLASVTPARIVSYTGVSNLAPLIEESNRWLGPAFSSLHRRFSQGIDCGILLDLLLSRRGYDRQTAAAAAGLSPSDLGAAIEDPVQGIDTLRRLCRTVGIDYRVLLPSERRHDAVGKLIMTVAEARTTVRGFGPYQFASMSNAPQLPDLTGLFMKICNDDARNAGYLTELADAHYLVVAGRPSIEWTSSAGKREKRELSPDASVWAAPMLRHRWLGEGSVLKFGSGNHVGYQDLLELTNTFAPAATLSRGYRDLKNWGYEGSH